MEIPFNGKISQQNYLQSQSLHRKLSIPIIVLGTILGLMIIGLIVSASSEPALFGTALPVVVILAVILGVVWWFPRFQAVNNWKNNKAFQDPIAGTVTSQGIHFTGAHFSSEADWEVYSDFKQSPNLLLLYQSPNSFNIFPKTFFKNEDDWAEFNKLVEEKISRDMSQKQSAKIRYVVITIVLIIIAVVAVINTINQ